jgi:hypothetical protein
MRVYVPVTVRMLHRLVEEGELSAVSGTAFAVTPALREAYVSGDDEELAEVAIREAALASLRLLAAEIESAAMIENADGSSIGSASAPAAGAAPPLRRAVLSADVDDVKLRPDLDDAVVRLSGPVAMSQVASAHIDLQDAEAAVAKALEVIDAADLGDPDAEFVLGDVEDHDLAWCAPQELPFLIELL